MLHKNVKTMNLIMKTLKNILKTGAGLAFLLGWVITVLSVSWIVILIVLFIAIVALVFWVIIGVEEGEDDKE